MNFSIIIPVYNEEENILILIEEIIKSIESKFTYEIIIVNDCSTDDTDKKLSQFLKFSWISTIKHKKNLGQSKSILTGINNSKYDTILTIDGDLQNDPKDINKLLNCYFMNDYSLVAGIRKKRKDSFIKIASSYLANKIRSHILNDNCVDTGCSLKVFRKNEFLKFPFFDGIHRFLPALFIGFKKKVFYIEVNHRYRISGVSKYGTFNRLIRGIIDTNRVSKIIRNQKNSND